MSEVGPVPPEFQELVEFLVRSLDPRGEDQAGPGGTPREIAQACVRTILSSGFEIRQLRSASETVTAAAVEEAIEKLKEARRPRTRDLIEIWRQLSDATSPASAEAYVEIGNRVLKAGEPLLAYDILKGGLEHWPTHARLRQLLALALARSGAPDAAAEILRKLLAETPDDEETLGLLARTCKDHWQTEVDPQQKSAALRESRRLYQAGYESAVAKNSADGAIYAGINAATTALLLGEADTASKLASEVAAICRSKPDADSDYWALATLGECAVIAGQIEEAAAHYCAAVALAEGNYADIASTRRNAELILSHRGDDLSKLSEWFPIPNVALFTGHLIDRPGKPVRFPHSRIEAVQAELQRVADENRVGFCFAAAACGGDLLFLKAAQNRDAECHIVLPLPPEQFREASVDVDPHRDWSMEFDQSLEQATDVTVVNDFSRDAQPVHFAYANLVMTGLAMLHARSLGAEVVPVTVWDGKPSRGIGGTGSLVEIWKQLGWKPVIIPPMEQADDSSESVSDTQTSSDVKSPSSDEFGMEVRAMLFADVVGYSKLTEEEIPLFIRDFMGSISECVQKTGVTIETGNTWGDAIYFVFNSVEDAGLTALHICDHVNSIDWVSRGLRSPLNLRTGLHVGPVYRFTDPVTKSRNHSGAHVSRAARIEPIAPAGEVYASDAFAAVAAAENVTSFRCDYVGITPMAKGYGDFPTYHVRRTAASETPD